MTRRAAAITSTYIRSLRGTPVFDGFEIGCEVPAGGDVRTDLTVEVRVLHDGLLLAADRYLLLGQEANRKIVLSDPGIDDSRNDLLWSQESPTLLDAELTLYGGEHELDRVFQETNGLLNADRSPKAPIDQIRAATLNGRAARPQPRSRSHSLCHQRRPRPA